MEGVGGGIRSRAPGVRRGTAPPGDHIIRSGVGRTKRIVGYRIHSVPRREGAAWPRLRADPCRCRSPAARAATEGSDERVPDENLRCGRNGKAKGKHRTTEVQRKMRY